MNNTNILYLENISMTRKREIIAQVEGIIKDYYKHLRKYGEGSTIYEAEETRNLHIILTRTIAAASRAVSKDSVYYLSIEKVYNSNYKIKEQLKYIIGSLGGLLVDLKQNYIDIIESKSITLEFDLIIEDIDLGDEKYQEVIKEINGTYQDFYFTSMYILIRKLLENLIYDCLKSYYGTKNVDKYYKTGDDRRHGFGILISNFNEMINDSDFKRDVGDVEQGYIDLLKEFQERGNKNAHSLFNLPHQDFIEKQKEKIYMFMKKLKDIMS